MHGLVMDRRRLIHVVLHLCLALLVSFESSDSLLFPTLLLDGIGDSQLVRIHVGHLVPLLATI